MAKRKTQSSKEPLLITKDTDLDLIYAADTAGNPLQFSTKSFKELTEKEWKKLSKEGVASYIVSREAVKRQEESLSNPPLPPYSITPAGVSAQEQIRVEKRDPKMHYAYVLPGQVEHRRRQGYVVANTSADEDLEVFNRRASTPIVGTVAKPELVLMKIPEEIFRKDIIGASVRESQQNNGQVEQTTKNAMERQGVIATQ